MEKRKKSDDILTCFFLCRPFYSTCSVIWDKRLFPSRDNRNIIPMDYTAPKPLEVDQVTTTHIKEFFVEFIKSSNLGQIANAHLARADASENGVFDEKCIRLAELHSQAVGKFLYV